MCVDNTSAKRDLNLNLLPTHIHTIINRNVNIVSLRKDELRLTVDLYDEALAYGWGDAVAGDTQVGAHV